MCFVGVFLTVLGMGGLTECWKGKKKSLLLSAGSTCHLVTRSAEGRLLRDDGGKHSAAESCNFEKRHLQHGLLFFLSVPTEAFSSLNVTCSMEEATGPMTVTGTENMKKHLLSWTTSTKQRSFPAV